MGRLIVNKTDSENRLMILMVKRELYVQLMQLNIIAQIRLDYQKND